MNVPAFTVGGGASKKTAEQRQKGVRAAAALDYRRFIEKHKREPDSEERQRMIDGLVTKGLVEERSLNPFSDKPFGVDQEAFGYETVLGAEEARRVGAPASAQARPTEQERMDQLILEGRSNDEIDSILAGEGY